MLRSLVFVVLVVSIGHGPTHAQLPLLGSGQFLDAGGNRFSHIYSINPASGVATPFTPNIFPSGNPAGLGFDTPNNRLLGYLGQQLMQVNLPSGSFTNIGSPAGISPTGFDILPDGRAFAAVGNETRLRTTDLSTGASTPFGPAATITAATGASSAFIISLGSVGTTLFGLDITSSSLVRVDANTGIASLAGTAGSLIAGTISTGPLAGLARSRFSGFASLTGYDSDADGQYDRLFGMLNFFDDDNNPGTPTIRFGGLADFDLTNGSWELIGSGNTGMIFFGMASPAAVPEPVTWMWIGISLGCFSYCFLRWRRQRQLSL